MQRLLFVWLMAALLLVSSNLAFAASEAENILQQHIEDVLKELERPEFKSPTQRDPVIARIETIVTSLFDFKELAARSVGVRWRSFSPDEQNRFTEAFTKLIFESYIEQFEGYNGETVKYLGEVSSSDGSKVEIATEVMVTNKPVSVSYRMIKKDSWVVYDVIIEGVSMIQNYRSQFQDILQNDSVDQVIGQIEQKAAALKQHNQKQSSNS